MTLKQAFLAGMILGFAAVPSKAYSDTMRIVNDAMNFSDVDTTTTKIKNMRYNAETKSYVIGNKKYYYTFIENLNQPDKEGGRISDEKARITKFLMQGKNEEEYPPWIFKKPSAAAKEKENLIAEIDLALIPKKFHYTFMNVLQSCGYNPEFGGRGIRVAIRSREEINNKIGYSPYLSVNVYTFSELEQALQDDLKQKEIKTRGEIKKLDDLRKKTIDDEVYNEIKPDLYGYIDAIFSENAEKAMSYLSESMFEKRAKKEKLNARGIKDKIVRNLKFDFAENDYTQFKLEEMLENRGMFIEFFNKENVKDFGEDYIDCDCVVKIRISDLRYIRLNSLALNEMSNIGFKREKKGWKIIKF